MHVIWEIPPDGSSVSLRIICQLKKKFFGTLVASLFISVDSYDSPSYHSIYFCFTRESIKSSASFSFILFVCVPQSLVPMPIVCVSLSFILPYFNPLWSLLFRFLLADSARSGNISLIFIADVFDRSVVAGDAARVTCVVTSLYVAPIESRYFIASLYRFLFLLKVCALNTGDRRFSHVAVLFTFLALLL